jgi:predicted TIM-barrel fold metal-dependent hydrolase
MAQVAESSPILVVSADGHAAPRTELYERYFEPQYLDDFHRYLSVHHHRFTPGHENSVFVPELRDVWKTHKSFEDGGFAGIDDPKRRLHELDRDGVAAELIFPDDTTWNAQPFCSGLEPMALEQVWSSDLRQAGARAHNRWMVDFCAEAPSRLLGLTSLGGLEDVNAVVAEIRRSFDAGLRTGIVLPLDYYLPLYHHPRYYPIWQICTDLGLPVTVHGADGGPDWYGDDLRATAVWLLEVNFWCRRPLWCFILGGVLERFPDLRVIFTEQGSSWIRPTLDEMDAVARSPIFRFSREQPFELLPSEFWERQCYVANSLMHSRSDFDDLQATTNKFMWGSDYPHVEGVWPEVRANMKELVGGRSEESIKWFLGGAASEAYRLDPRAVADVVDRIGPTLAELAEAPSTDTLAEVRITPIK